MIRRILTVVLLVGGLLPLSSIAAGPDCRLGWMTYDGPNSGTDWVSALALDASGNVFVVGREQGLTKTDDWRILKVDPTLTTVLASTNYDGPAGLADFANDVAVDGLGNVLVGGYESGTTGGQNWRIRKYAPDLATLLATTAYDGPTGGNDNLSNIMLDAAGNLVAAGSEAGVVGGTNWRILKWDPGITVLLGSTDYDGPSSGSDGINTLAVDSTGNVVVAGTQSSPTTDWCVRKYNATLSTLLGATSYNGTGNGADNVRAVARDGSGNLILAGFVVDIVGGQNWAIRKYSPDLSTLLASTEYDAPASLGDSAWACVLAPSGHVLAGGSETTATGYVRARIMEWSADLSVLISVTGYDGPGGVLSNVRSMAFTPQGRLIVAGRERSVNWDEDWTLLSFGFDGQCPQPPVPPPVVGAESGKILIRGNVIRPGSGVPAVIAAQGTAGGVVDLTLYSNGGRAVAKLGSITLDGSGEGTYSFDGRFDGRPLKSGVYWIITTGAVKDRKPVMIVTTAADLK